MSNPVRFFAASYSDQGVTRTVRIPEYEKVNQAPLTNVAIVINRGSGAFQAGLYVNRGARWLFALSYDDVDIAFSGDYRVSLVINPVSPVVGGEGAILYRNGYQTTGTTVPVIRDTVWTLLVPKVTAPTQTGNQGVSGARDYYEHVQSSAQQTWTISHYLGKYPSVTILDSANDEIEGTISHSSKYVAVVTFSAATSGTAVCN